MLDKDEFYQLKEEIAPMLGKVLLGKLVDEEFKQTDIDRNGVISQKEFLQAYQKIFNPSSQINISTEPASIIETFFQFVEASTLADVLRKFSELQELCGFDKNKSETMYDLLKRMTQSNTQASVLWKLLDKKKSHPEYKSKNMDKCHILIVGAGPGGLRLAIEAAFLGAKSITVIEKRRKYSRNNVKRKIIISNRNYFLLT